MTEESHEIPESVSRLYENLGLRIHKLETFYLEAKYCIILLDEQQPLFSGCYRYRISASDTSQRICKVPSRYDNKELCSLTRLSCTVLFLQVTPQFRVICSCFSEMNTHSLKSEFDCSVNIFCVESFTHVHNRNFEPYSNPYSDATIISIVWNL